MSIDPKTPKPLPSADEINAYLELSAARTKLRLPLAKGAARVGTLPDPKQPAVENSAARALQVSASKKLPTRREEPSSPAPATAPPSNPGGPEVWRPFPSDDER